MLNLFGKSTRVKRGVYDVWVQLMKKWKVNSRGKEVLPGF